MQGRTEHQTELDIWNHWSENMSERTTNALLAVLAVLALALFVAMGGDGPDLEDHAAWMASAKERGTLVMW